MQNLIDTLRLRGAAEEVPEFMSCSSFESETEYILHTVEPRLLFEVSQEGDKEDPYTLYVEHENGDVDYVVLVDCYSPSFFEQMSAAQVTECVAGVMDELEGWYISEVLDLDSYEQDEE